MEFLTTKDTKLGRIETFFNEQDPSKQIVDAAFKVHQILGPGLLESAYEECLALELSKRGFQVERQKTLPINYEGHRVDAGYRLDLVINNYFIIELKALEKLAPVHEAQMITYLKLSKIPIGFLINFNVRLFKDGIKRFCL